jgi:hypothetical protein
LLLDWPAAEIKLGESNFHTPIGITFFQKPGIFKQKKPPKFWEPPLATD